MSLFLCVYRGDERENQCAVPGWQIALLFKDNQAVPPSSLQCPFCWAWTCKGKPECWKWSWKWEIPIDRLLKYHFTPRVEHEDRKCWNVWVQGLGWFRLYSLFYVPFFILLKFGGTGVKGVTETRGVRGQKMIVLVTYSKIKLYLIMYCINCFHMYDEWGTL